jgi:DNA-binding MarR family transcriptional regulator
MAVQSARLVPSGDTLQFMQRLWDLVHALEVRSKYMGRHLGVTGPQRLVLRIVGQSPRCTAREISSTLGLHPSTLTGILARLEQRGLLTRTIDRADRRRARFALTRAGAAINRERRGTVEAAVRRAIARTPPPAILATAAFMELLAAELAKPG